MLLIQAFRRKFIIPEFDVFVKKINKIYDAVEKSSDGKVSVCSFVPDALSEAEPRELKGCIILHCITFIALWLTGCHMLDCFAYYF